ncbi:hypothetical protein LCGC14_3088500, partial [marine sediment metagenome]
MIFIIQILEPRDFGLVAIALLTLSIFEVFTKAGFQESLIQKQGDIETYLNSIWTVLLLRGFILYGLIFTFSPFISAFFIEPRAENLIKVLSLVLILRGLTNIGVVFFKKDLEFKKQFILDLSKTLPDFIGSLKIEMEGPLTTTRIENNRPYTLFANNSVNLFGRAFPNGSYRLMATPFTQANAQGTAGAPLEINFEVIGTPASDAMKVYPVSFT